MHKFKSMGLEDKKKILRKYLMLLFFCGLFQYSMNAQQNNVFYSLTSQSISIFIDTLYLWNHENIEYPLIDSTICLFLRENNINVMNHKFNHPMCGIVEQKNGLVKFYRYSYDSTIQHGFWYYLKSLHLKRKNSIHVLLTPGYDFASDTLVITIRSAYLHYNKTDRFSKKKNNWITSICDWGVFKYIYSKEEQTWILMNSVIGSI